MKGRQSSATAGSSREEELYFDIGSAAAHAFLSEDDAWYAENEGLATSNNSASANYYARRLIDRLCTLWHRMAGNGSNFSDKNCKWLWSSRGKNASWNDALPEV